MRDIEECGICGASVPHGTACDEEQAAVCDNNRPSGSRRGDDYIDAILDDDR